MASMVLIAVLLAAVVGFSSYYVARKQASSELDAVKGELSKTQLLLSSANSDFEARQQELRKSIEEAHTRESEAKRKAENSETRSLQVADELKAALEEKGRLRSEATRVEETKALVAERDTRIDSLQSQIQALEGEKAAAVKEAEAADRRATDLIAKEREAQTEIVKAKDEQIVKLNEFIAQAREVLSTEFKALSSDALKDATDRLVKTADGIIEKHGEKTTADVHLHEKHIETLLEPMKETMKRLDKHVEDTNLARTAAEALLGEQVKRLAGASDSLTNALRKPVVRGSWGEMTLENALESAGLEPRSTTFFSTLRMPKKAVANAPTL